jgi:hypothetical protein
LRPAGIPQPEFLIGRIFSDVFDSTRDPGFVRESLLPNRFNSRESSLLAHQNLRIQQPSLLLYSSIL